MFIINDLETNNLNPLEGEIFKIILNSGSHGLGVFETIKLVPTITSGGANLSLTAEYLDEHLLRMENSLKATNLYPNDWDKEKVKFETLNFIKRIPQVPCALKITLYFENQENTVLYFSHENRVYTKEMLEKGFHLTLGKLIRNPSLLNVNHKTLATLDNILELRRVRKLGFNEAVLLNSDGFVAEGTISNIFIKKDGVIYTPPLSAGILPGIMRAQIIKKKKEQGKKVIEKLFTFNELKDADEIFLTNSLMGIMKAYL
ncbi:MAG: aminotransferase class IV [Succinivibrionaceae bacterium]|nr:aminotransferase class IV [Ruminobacter sp.]MDY5779609.1 aminotransferase class IV [Succinivibrionaceae bacterium]MEE1340144.1 aminotransferase class IV [Succinivibrionaceae bacterium]